MKNSETNKGIGGYVLNGIDGIIGESGNSIIYSSIGKDSSIEEYIQSGKTLSNNPEISKIPYEYKEGDIIIDTYGKVYETYRENILLCIKTLGNILPSNSEDEENQEESPITMYVSVSTSAGNITNTYNYHTSTKNDLSCLYRHIVDNQRSSHAGFKLIPDNSHSFKINGTTYTTKTFIQSNLSSQTNRSVACVKYVIVFRTGLLCEFLLSADGHGNNVDWITLSPIADYRYLYMEGVGDSVYDSSRYQDIDSPYNTSSQTLNTNKALLNLNTDDAIKSYFEFYVKETDKKGNTFFKNLRANVEYV